MKFDEKDEYDYNLYGDDLDNNGPIDDEDD